MKNKTIKLADVEKALKMMQARRKVSFAEWAANQDRLKALIESAKREK